MNVFVFSKADHAKSIHQTKNTNANITKFYLLKIHENRSLSLLEYEKCFVWTKFFCNLKKKKNVLCQLPYMQEEQTHNKAMQLNLQIPCMYRLKNIYNLFQPHYNFILLDYIMFQIQMQQWKHKLKQ